ncbi:MAG: ATP-binding cassette domain-containing protein, partial [Calditrichia bacterium]
KREIAADILKEINQRLNYLNDVGLSYLDLNRRSNTLSGGEFQRINLATALGTALTETLYILDEPTIGLHPRDTGKLIGILKSLSRIGNTALVVEHDPQVMEYASRIIDLGPASGEQGGEVIFNGTYKNLVQTGKGLTAEYLQGKKNVPIKKIFARTGSKYLAIKGAREHNLKNIEVQIPLGLMVAITGVSGSGKSTLVHDILYHGYQTVKGNVKEKVGKHDRIEGIRNIKGMIMVDQSPIGRTPRSNPITYVKGFDEIRKLFAGTPQSRSRNFKPGHFSFNVPGGRCEVCQGDGQIKIEMQFLADVYIKCEACGGKRYKPMVLDVYFKGKNINEVLDLTVDQAYEFFSDHPAIIRKLQILKDVGLGYLKLGQPATTLSGGEAQRIKLAAHLSQKNQKDILFIFDEPTTGLHFDDIAKLLGAFDQLIKQGASVMIIEHNLSIIRYADWIIALRPLKG